MATQTPIKEEVERAIQTEHELHAAHEFARDAAADKRVQKLREMAARDKQARIAQAMSEVSSTRQSTAAEIARMRHDAAVQAARARDEAMREAAADVERAKAEGERAIKFLRSHELQEAHEAKRKAEAEVQRLELEKREAVHAATAAKYRQPPATPKPPPKRDVATKLDAIEAQETALHDRGVELDARERRTARRERSTRREHRSASREHRHAAKIHMKLKSVPFVPAAMPSAEPQTGHVPQVARPMGGSRVSWLTGSQQIPASQGDHLAHQSSLWKWAADMPKSIERPDSVPDVPEDHRGMLFQASQLAKAILAKAKAGKKAIQLQEMQDAAESLAGDGEAFPSDSSKPDRLWMYGLASVLGTAAGLSVSEAQEIAADVLGHDMGGGAGGGTPRKPRAVRTPDRHARTRSRGRV